VNVFVLVNTIEEESVIFIEYSDEIRVIRSIGSKRLSKVEARTLWDELLKRGFELEEWQDEENTWTEIDKVYSGRVDCMPKQEGVLLLGYKAGDNINAITI
jgi:hypothetical protein